MEKTAAKKKPAPRKAPATKKPAPKKAPAKQPPRKVAAVAAQKPLSRKRAAAKSSMPIKTIIKTRVVEIEEEDGLIPSEQARERLGLTQRQETWLISEKRLKPTKIGRRNYYQKSYIEDIIANGLPE